MSFCSFVSLALASDVVCIASFFYNAEIFNLLFVNTACERLLVHVCVAVTVSCLCRLIVCEEMCEILHHMYVLQAVCSVHRALLCLLGL